MSECESGACGCAAPSPSVSSRTVLILVLVSAAAVLIEYLKPGMLPISLAWVGVALCGVKIIYDGVRALLRADFRANVLVMIAIVAAALIGEVMAAAEIAIIMSLGEMLEDWTVARAGSGFRRMDRVLPRTARRMGPDGSETVVPVEEVEAGDIIRVQAGEKVPVDGTVLSGNPVMDTSMITGESTSRVFAEGDSVTSGMVDVGGHFTFRADRTAADSTFQKMVCIVRKADAEKAKVVSMADKWSVIIVIIAVVCAVSSYLTIGNILRSVTILVAFCPIGMVLATPTAITAAIGNLTYKRILVREGDALERLSNVSSVIFDKIGTITFDWMTVHDVFAVTGVSEDRFVAMAMAAEAGCDHPIGKAIREYAEEKGLKAEGTDIRYRPGSGVTAEVYGSRVMLGSPEMLRKSGVTLPGDADTYGMEDGYVIVFGAIDGVYAGYIALSDTIRYGAEDAVRDMYDRGYSSVMLTKDRQEIAYGIARKVGIKMVIPECTPEDQIAAIEKLESMGSYSCMIGDGEQNAVALKRAHVGVGMGGVGSDAGVEASDIIISGDGIDDISHMLALSKRMMAAIRVSISLALCFNVGGIVFASVGLLTPLTAAIVHCAGAVIAIMNAAMLVRWKLDKDEQRTPDCCDPGGDCSDGSGAGKNGASETAAA